MGENQKILNFTFIRLLFDEQIASNFSFGFFSSKGQIGIVGPNVSFQFNNIKPYSMSVSADIS